MLKKMLCFSVALILIISSFIFSYAASYFPIIPYYNGTINYNNIVSNGVVIGTNGQDYYTVTGISASDVYYFFVPGSGVIMASESTGRVYISNSGSYTDYVLITKDNTTNLWYTTYGNATISNAPQYSTTSEGLLDLRDYIDNGPSASDPIYDDLPNFNIQRGYAAYIDFGSDWNTRSISGTLTSSFPQYSSLISGDWDGTDNRRYFWTDSLPSNTNFTSNVGSAIDWTKVPPYDLLQRSKNGIWFIQSNSPLNRYLVIVNPNQWRYGQNPTDDTINSPITVSDLSGSTGDVKFFALNQKFDTDGTLVSAASDNASNNRTGTYDPDTGQWEMTDPSGNAADQVPGGESDTPVISSISDYIHNITSVLTNFANSVISLIQAPISHISELINAGSGFMSSLRGMYAWLPVDIQGLIIAALTVVIGIGVFKVFL